MRCKNLPKRFCSKVQHNETNKDRSREAATLSSCWTSPLLAAGILYKQISFSVLGDERALWANGFIQASGGLSPMEG